MAFFRLGRRGWGVFSDEEGNQIDMMVLGYGIRRWTGQSFPRYDINLYPQFEAFKKAAMVICRSDLSENECEGDRLMYL